MEYNTFEKVQEYLDGLKPIYFLGTFTDTFFKDLNTMDVVKKFFQLNNSYPTYYRESVGKDIQVCRINARRTIGDIYRIIHYYRPDITLKEIHAVLCELNMSKQVYSFICPDIHQRVWREHTQMGRYFDHVEHDEYKLPYEGMFVQGLYRDKNKNDLIYIL